MAMKKGEHMMPNGMPMKGPMKGPMPKMPMKKGMPAKGGKC